MSVIPVDVKMIGGVNLLADPLRIRDDQCVRLKNLYPNDQGKMALRKGAKHSKVLDVDFVNRRPTNFWQPRLAPTGVIWTEYDTSTNKVFLRRVNAGGTTTSLEMATDSGLFRPAIVEINQRVLVSAGVINAAATASIHNAVIVAGEISLAIASVNFFKSDGTRVSPKVLGLYQGRVVYANFGLGYEDVMVISDNRGKYNIISATGTDTIDIGAPAGSTFSSTTDARVLRLTQFAGDSIVAVQEIAQGALGNIEEAALLILGSETAIIAPGSITLTSETGDPAGTFAPRLLNYPCGCVSAQTVVRTPMGVLWAGWNDVWAMDMGGVPVRVGTNIRSALSDPDPLTRFLWHAAYDADTGSYRLAVTHEDQSTPNSGKLEYPCQDQWWLDLRGGLPKSAEAAQWFGPQRYLMYDQITSPASSGVHHPGTFMMRTRTTPGVDDSVFAVHVANDPGGSAPRGPVMVEMDLLEGRDRAISEASPWTVRAQDANAILFEVLTKEYDCDDPYVDKTYLGADISIWGSDPLSILVETQVNGAQTQESVAVNLDQIGNVTTVDPSGSRVTHPYQAVAVMPDEGTAMSGKTFQFRIYNRDGYPVAENGLLQTALVCNNVGGATYLDATVVAGFYATQTAFLDALMTALTATGFFTGGAPTHSISSSLVRITVPTVPWHFLMIADHAGSESARRSNKMGLVLGIGPPMNDILSTTSGGNELITGTTIVPMTIAPQVELAGIVLKMYQYGRRPSGPKNEVKIP